MWELRWASVANPCTAQHRVMNSVLFEIDADCESVGADLVSVGESEMPAKGQQEIAHSTNLCVKKHFGSAQQ